MSRFKAFDEEFAGEFGDPGIDPEREAELDEQNGNGVNPLASLLDTRRNGIGEPPTKPEPVYSLAGSVIATSGNLIAVQAQSKAGKTAWLGGMMASTFGEDGDFLGIVSSNPNGKAVVVIDSEQSPFDSWMLVQRAMKRAGVVKMPAWLRSYCVTDLLTAQRRAALRYELERAHAEHGGLHSAIIDGVADLIGDPNDAGEAFGMVEELHSLAIRYQAPIICVIHENPASQYAKTRGHLGSQCERKAETNIRLEKAADGITTVWVERGRHCHIPKERGPRFVWNDEKQMHVTTTTTADVKAEAKRDDLRELATEIFSKSSGLPLSWTEVHKRIEKLDGVKREGARRRFKELVAYGVIFKSDAGYRLSKS